MNDRPFVVGVEGPCCAGKTTLTRGLREQLSIAMTVGCVKDYADWAGGGRFLPPAHPESLQDEEAALHMLLQIEADRTAAVRGAFDQLDLILVDRSVHTLAAHCAGLSTLTGLDYRSTAEKVLGDATDVLWPDLLLYLDIDPATIAARNNGKFGPASLFIDPQFNAGVRTYFDQLAGVSQQRVGWFDGGSSATLLCRQALDYLAELLPTRAD